MTDSPSLRALVAAIERGLTIAPCPDTERPVRHLHLSDPVTGAMACAPTLIEAFADLERQNAAARN